MTERVPIGAEAGAKLRVLKTRLERQCVRIDRAFADPEFLPQVRIFTLKKSPTGRSRAFVKLCRMLGPGARAESVGLRGRPLAAWLYFRPRISVIIEDVPDEPGLGQNCITVNYLLAGELPEGGVGHTDGLWTLEFSDHALGLFFERSRRRD